MLQAGGLAGGVYGAACYSILISFLNRILHSEFTLGGIDKKITPPFRAGYGD
jgi:hypothetical protein